MAGNDAKAQAEMTELAEEKKVGKNDLDQTSNHRVDPLLLNDNQAVTGELNPQACHTTGESFTTKKIAQAQNQHSSKTIAMASKEDEDESDTEVVAMEVEEILTKDTLNEGNADTNMSKGNQIVADQPKARVNKSQRECHDEVRNLFSKLSALRLNFQREFDDSINPCRNSITLAFNDLVKENDFLQERLSVVMRDRDNLQSTVAELEAEVTRLSSKKGNMDYTNQEHDIKSTMAGDSNEPSEVAVLHESLTTTSNEQDVYSYRDSRQSMSGSGRPTPSQDRIRDNLAQLKSQLSNVGSSGLSVIVLDNDGVKKIKEQIRTEEVKLRRMQLETIRMRKRREKGKDAAKTVSHSNPRLVDKRGNDPDGIDPLFDQDTQKFDMTSVEDMGAGECTDRVVKNEHLEQGDNFETSRENEIKNTLMVKSFDCLCKICGMEFADKKELDTHHKTAVHLENNDHECNYCGAGFPYRSHLERHIKQVHCKRVRNRKEIDCEECGKTLGDKSYLKAHVKAVHLKIRDQICNECGATFTRKDKLMRHAREVHLRETTRY